MRLATCVLAELAIGTTLITGAAGGAVWAVTEIRSSEELSAAAETMPQAPAPAVPAPEPTTQAIREPALAPPPVEQGPTFAGRPDEELLAPLREKAIARVKIGSCCTSLNMRIDFEGGARAAFKPEQRNLGSMPRKEIAAYRIDRLLGIGAVPPAIPRRFAVEEIAANMVGAGPAERLRVSNEMVAQGGQAVGELTWWIPELAKPSIEGLPIDSAEGVEIWQRHLTVGAEIPPEHERLASQISRVLLFDFVINNIDRWSGGNIRSSKDGSILYFMDNTMSFRPQPRGHQKVRSYLRRAQRFSRGLVAALRGLRLEELRGAVGRDLGPMEYLLTEQEMAAVIARRDDALAYVDALVARHGEAAVLVFP